MPKKAKEKTEELNTKTATKKSTTKAVTTKKTASKKTTTKKTSSKKAPTQKGKANVEKDAAVNTTSISSSRQKSAKDVAKEVTQKASEKIKLITQKVKENIQAVVPKKEESNSKKSADTKKKKTVSKKNTVTTKKETSAKKAMDTKTATKKATDTKTTAKKTTTKKASDTKTIAKKSATKKALDTKTVAKKATTKKDSDTKTTVKKTATKKASDTKAAAKKTATKKTTSAKTSKSKAANTTKKATVSTQSTEYYDLPFRYNQTLVKILAQTPNMLFIYWDISDADRQAFEKQYGENFFEITRPVLIISNMTMHYTFEVEINDFANSWYLHINDANCNYKVELGRRFRVNFNHDTDHVTPYQMNEYLYITSSDTIEAPNDHILLDQLGKSVFFRNVKTNFIEERNISSLSYLQSLGRIYHIYDLYKELYQDELNLDQLSLDLPSSNSSPTYK